jgi:uncharacterized damage-inducible protein DinB
MSEPVLTAQETLKWYETTATNWRKFLAAQPGILSLPCSIAKTTTVAQLLQHIVAVELRYAERISNLPESDYSNIAYDSVEAIYATHDRASALYNDALNANLDWDKQLEFTTRAGIKGRASLKTMFFHATFHSIRHYAQLSTLLREHGHATDWYGDYLFMGVTRL